MELLNDIVVGGFAVAPVIVGLVAALKKFGMPVKYAPVANGLLAAVLWLVAVYFVPQYPQIEEVAKYVMGVVVVFLGASGIYQFGKTSK